MQEYEQLKAQQRFSESLQMKAEIDALRFQLADPAAVRKWEAPSQQLSLAQMRENIAKARGVQMVCNEKMR